MATCVASQTIKSPKAPNSPFRCATRFNTGYFLVETIILAFSNPSRRLRLILITTQVVSNVPSQTKAFILSVLKNQFRIHNLFVGPIDLLSLLQIKIVAMRLVLLCQCASIHGLGFPNTCSLFFARHSPISYIDCSVKSAIWEIFFLLAQLRSATDNFLDLKEPEAIRIPGSPSSVADETLKS